jgi:pimeloyl-ACP methyl ester carboxylesterase
MHEHRLPLVGASPSRRIRFCTAPDGVRLAWAKHGSGPAIVKAANRLTHLEFDWESPVWHHWLEGLGDRHTLVRYDERGCGLSDRDTKALSLDRWVADLETVVDTADLNRFVLLGISQGAATAIAYAVRHPDRVDRLGLHGGYARGRGQRGEQQRQRLEALISAVHTGWTNPDPTFRHLFTMLFLPQSSPEQMGWYDELQRQSTSAENAVRLYRARAEVDVSELAPRVTAKTLVAHARGERVVRSKRDGSLASLTPRRSGSGGETDQRRRSGRTSPRICSAASSTSGATSGSFSLGMRTVGICTAMADWAKPEASRTGDPMQRTPIWVSCSSKL